MGRGRKLDLFGVLKKGKLPRRVDLKFALVVVPISLVLIGLALVVATRPKARATPAPAELVAPVAGEVRIPLDHFSGGSVKFFRYAAAGGVEVRFLAVEAPQGVYRVALDASDNASAAVRQHADQLACTHCRLHFSTAVIGEARGGCFPIRLPHRIVGQDLVIQQVDLEQARRYFTGVCTDAGIEGQGDVQP